MAKLYRPEKATVHWGEREGEDDPRFLHLDGGPTLPIKTRVSRDRAVVPSITSKRPCVEVATLCRGSRSGHECAMPPAASNISAMADHTAALRAL